LPGNTIRFLTGWLVKRSGKHPTVSPDDPGKIPDYLNFDSSNDIVFDVVNSGGKDADANGMVDQLSEADAEDISDRTDNDGLQQI